MQEELCSKKDFAALCGVTQGRVSQWIAEGKIDPGLLVGRGRYARIKTDQALVIVRPPANQSAPSNSTLYPKRRRSHPKTACIYIIAADGGPVKIGISSNPASRLKRLCTGAPYRLRVAHIEEMASAKEVEMAAHLWLARYRLHGEWFAVSVEMAKAAVLAAAAFLETRPALQ